jgi:hypothetical protein
LRLPPDAASQADIDVFVTHNSAPGAMRAEFEYFRAFPADAEQNRESAKAKIPMPVLVMGGDIYPALGGDFPGNLLCAKFNASISCKCNWHHSSTFRTLDSR